MLNILILGAVSLIMASCATTRIPADYSGLFAESLFFWHSAEQDRQDFVFMLKSPPIISLKKDYLQHNAFHTLRQRRCKGTTYYTVQGHGVIIQIILCRLVCPASIVLLALPFPYHDGLATAKLQTQAGPTLPDKEEMLLPLCNWDVAVPLTPVLPVYMAHFASQSDARAALKGKIYFPVNGYTVTRAITSQPEITCSEFPETTNHPERLCDHVLT